MVVTDKSIVLAGMPANSLVLLLAGQASMAAAAAGSAVQPWHASHAEVRPYLYVSGFLRSSTGEV